MVLRAEFAGCELNSALRVLVNWIGRHDHRNPSFLLIQFSIIGFVFDRLID